MNSKLEYLYGTEAVESCLKSNFRNKISLYVSQDSFLNRAHHSNDIISKQQRIEHYAKEKNIPIVKLSNDKLSQFSGQRDHEGVILKVNKKEYFHIKKPDLFFKSIIKHESNLFIILDQITDPQNFGSIIRSSYLLGADCVLVNKSNKPPFSPAIAKVSSGVSEVIPVMTIKFIKLFLEEAINLNYKVITTYVNDEKYQSQNVNKLKLSKGENVIVIFGSEGLGVSEILKSSSNINVKIPGLNNDKLVDSLNVGVSAGILIHKIASLIK